MLEEVDAETRERMLRQFDMVVMCPHCQKPWRSMECDCSGEITNKDQVLAHIGAMKQRPALTGTWKPPTQSDYDREVQLAQCFRQSLSEEMDAALSRAGVAVATGKKATD